MANVDDYRLADCARFRLPPIDVSHVSAVIEQALFKAWESGQSAEAALNMVLRDHQVIDRLAGQIAPNLEFQRTRATQRVDEQTTGILTTYEQQKRTEAEKIERTLGAEAAAKERKANEEKTALQGKYEGYSATQARLEELRKRVYDKLEKIGGRQGFETLLRINGEVTAAPAQYGTRHDGTRKGRRHASTPMTSEGETPEGARAETATETAASRKETGYVLPKELRSALDLATTPKDLLRRKTLDELVAEKQVQPEEGIFTRVYHAIKSVLMYKL